MSRETYKILYKTIHLPSGKYYIGIHETSNLNDGYLGSGLILKRMLAKYPKEDFKREIIDFCSTREELNQKERYILQIHLREKNNINIAFGGEGGPTFFAIRDKDYTRYIKLKEEQKERFSKTCKRGRESMKRLRKVSREFREKMGDISRNNLKKITPEGLEKARLKKRETFSHIGHQQGSKNSQFGTRWIHRDTINKKIKREDAIPEGWEIGRRLK